MLPSPVLKLPQMKWKSHNVPLQNTVVMRSSNWQRCSPQCPRQAPDQFIEYRIWTWTMSSFRSLSQNIEFEPLCHVMNLLYKYRELDPTLFVRNVWKLHHLGGLGYNHANSFFKVSPSSLWLQMKPWYIYITVNHCILPISFDFLF